MAENNTIQVQKTDGTSENEGGEESDEESIKLLLLRTCSSRIETKTLSVSQLSIIISDKLQSTVDINVTLIADRTSLASVRIACCKNIDKSTIIKYDHENLWLHSGSKLYLMDAENKNFRGLQGDMMILHANAPNYEHLWNHILIPCWENGTECLVWVVD